MKWSYQEFTNQSVFTVIGQVSQFLNTLGIGNIYTKFDICNQKDGDARGIVFYLTERATPEPSLPVTENVGWEFLTWDTDHDYRSMYDSFLTVLNTRLTPSKFRLDEQQVLNARAVFTNMLHGKSTLSLVYPTNVK